MGPVKADDKVREVIREQEYFDHAMDAHLDKVHRFDSALNGPGTAVERRAMKGESAKVHRLGPEDSAAIMRVDLSDGDRFYLGKTAILHDGEALVINWKEKAGSLFYQSTPDDPRGVLSKRNYTTDGNRIKDFQDTVLAQIAEDIEQLESYGGTEDPLLTSLEAKRSGELKDVVGTIQAAQNQILRTPKDSLLVVQGGPGTGKTIMALHRASWLLFEYREQLAPDDVLIVGPNPAFTKYIQKVLPDLGDASVRQTSIQGMLQRDLPARSTEPDTVARIKGSARMQDVIANGLDDRIKRPTGPLRIRRRNSVSTITLLPEVLAEDVKELRTQYYGVGRELMKARMLERCAEALGQRAGASVDEIVDPRSLDAELNKIWPQLSAAQFIRELLGSKQRLRAAAGKALAPGESDLIHRPAAERIAEEPWTIADLALIDEAASFMQDRQELWGHIVVDEAQDLTPMQLAALRRRSRNGSMTLVGDLAQSTGPFARESWEDVIGDLRSNLDVIKAELEFGYRVPRQVFTVAAPVLKLAAPQLIPPTIVRDVKDEPTLFDVSPGVLTGEVARLASHHSAKGRFVGVIAQPARWDSIVEAFEAQDLHWSDSTQGGLGSSINMVTPEASKGLEFEAVIVVDPQAILDQDQGARLLYIAMTRTTNRLEVVVPAGEVPEVLSDAFTTVQVIQDNVGDQVLAGVVSGEGETAEAIASGVATSPPDDGDSDERSCDELHDGNGRMVSSPLEARSEHGAREDLASHRQIQGVDSAYRDEPKPTPIQRELILRNAQYLADIVIGSYGPTLRASVLREALRLVESSGTQR